MSKIWFPAPEPPSKLGRYRQLSPLAGVRVSPICFGAMSIGDKWEKLGMGAMNKESSFELLDAFYEGGGNFIDTANSYQDESSEAFIGEWMESRAIRDQIVIATKVHEAPELETLSELLSTQLQYTTNFKRDADDIKQKVHYTGNNLKAMHISVEASLKKLRTDYIDIFYVHWVSYLSYCPRLQGHLRDSTRSGTGTPAWRKS